MIKFMKKCSYDKMTEGQNRTVMSHQLNISEIINVTAVNKEQLGIVYWP